MSEMNELGNLENTPEVEETENPVEPGTTEQETQSDESTENAEEASGDSENKTDSETAKKKSHGVEKRIAKLVKEREEAAREAAYLRGVLAATQGQGAVNQATEPLQVDPEAPNPNDFADPTDYKVELRLYQREKEAKNKEFQERLAEAHSKHPDLQDLIDDDEVKSSPTIIEAIKSSEIAGELYYYCMSHPDETNEIAKMSPIKAAKAMGKIEAKLTVTPATKSAISKAPAPITPVKTSNVNASKTVKTKDYISY